MLVSPLVHLQGDHWAFRKPVEVTIPIDKSRLPKSATAAQLQCVLALGGSYLSAGASLDPQLLAGKSHRQIAAALSDPASPIALAVDGSANVITAALCKVTGQQPAEVCSATGVTAAAKTLAQGNK